MPRLASRAHLSALIASLLWLNLTGGTLSAAEELPCDITLTAGDWYAEGGDHHTYVPARATILVPQEMEDWTAVTLHTEDGKEVAGQLTPPRLLAYPDLAPRHARDLLVLLDTTVAGKSIHFTKISADSDAGTSFQWKDAEESVRRLTWGEGDDERPVLQYMYKPFDNSSPEGVEETKKVFHHVFDPHGEFLITKGPGGQYSHHRGLFYGFNKISYGEGKQADSWHLNKGESMTHEGFLNETVGPLVGRHRVSVFWQGQDGKTFAVENRELTTYNVDGVGTFIEFASRLRSTIGGTVHLDGDPQHAGFQFRASQEVAESTNKETYYLRPDGKGKKGETRNWDHQNPEAEGNEISTNLPWNAMSFIVNGERFTTVYVDHPDNPKPARYSERDYGRFGSYFVHDLEPGKPLEIKYRVWIHPGELIQEQAASLSEEFVNPPKLEVKSIGEEEGGTAAIGDNQPPEGFVALFDGETLEGWQGFVANPIAIKKLSDEERAAAQEKANERMKQHWSVVDGAIMYDGSREGANLVTAKEYGNFELLIDWKIEEAGDSGIYLRGTPQVQIFDTDHADFFRHGANLGSGSLWNNQKHSRWPLTRADRPAGQWNTFRIRMEGDKVSIWLNGQKVVHETVLENFFDRGNDLFASGPIELQKHDGKLWFKNIYLKELD